MNVIHLAPVRFFVNRIAGLLLGADKKDRLAICNSIGNKIISIPEHADGFLKINNIDTVSCPEDILLHLGVPSLGLVTKMDSCFKEFLHCNISHSDSSFHWFFHRLFPPCFRPSAKAPGIRSEGV